MENLIILGIVLLGLLISLAVVWHSRKEGTFELFMLDDSYRKGELLKSAGGWLVEIIENHGGGRYTVLLVKQL